VSVAARKASLPLRLAGASALCGTLGIALVALLSGSVDALDGSVETLVGPLAVGALGVLVGAVSVGLAARTTNDATRRAAEDALLLGRANETRVPLGAVSALDETATLARALAALRTKIAEGRSRDARARAEAEDADRYKTDFLMAVSHELRTPLNAILGFADVLLRELDGPLSEGAREDVATIQGAGSHLRDLFEDVIDLSALASSRITLQREPVDVGPLLEETSRLLEGQRRGKPIALRVVVADGTLRADADPKRVRQIVTNLGTNALKFTEQGEITFELSGNEEHVEIVVRDTGSGITQAELETLFTEYTQVGDVKRRTRGTGLGLAICKQLSELHGGSIKAESSFGQGSAFIVRLPTYHSRGNT